MLKERAICLYKSTHIGTALEETLSHLSNTGEINDDIKEQFLHIFCDTLIEKIEQTNDKSLSIKGYLETYRHIDDEWTFYVKNAQIISGGEQSDNIKMLKIVAISSEHKKAEQSGEKLLKKRKLKESR